MFFDTLIIGAGLSGAVLAERLAAAGKKVLVVERRRTAGDIRQLQLAKGAIRAGMKILLEKADISEEEVSHIYLAGAFGSYIKGFGTPVYNPDQEIDPMIPSDENTYLAASIKVLSWRVVSSNVDLDQTK